MDEMIYVGGLEADTTDEQLLDLFRPFGAQVAQVTRSAADGGGASSGKVVFADRLQAAAACRAMNGRERDGRLLAVHLVSERPWDVYRSRRGAPWRERRGPALGSAAQR